MQNNLKQEFFKFSHQRIPIVGIIALIILMLYSAVSGSGVNQALIAQGFGAGQWVTIIMITISSTFVAMEYENNTIATLFYKSSSKAKIYMAKFLIIVLYGVALLLVSIVTTMIFKVTFVGGQYHWTEAYQQSNLIGTLFLNLIGTFIYVLFIVSFAFLLITLIKNNPAVVGIGLAIVFLGSPFSSMIMSGFSAWIPILRWNPLNMIYVMNQMAMPRVFAKVSYLSTFQIVLGNIVYIVGFILVGCLLFKKQRV
ncbi:ABC transporter permease [Lentilactobacillus parafarraginis]|uniref:ABC superfamily ATP binding cassette transporter, membrane protein n=1 Tax=Lentilactobacillus parafarraginis DSM 18390 = JCM 14109 TaxID=1423786 RepID=A0A0R1YF44_9LACO|nr:ABC transporter permease [Lentilactobacillus parafarraginis]KRM40613.1 hypothetical protein FD47_GL002729 [Lentilactobacillus parafarraginis DSM 18390 = JCM 14109]